MSKLIFSHLLSTCMIGTALKLSFPATANVSSGDSQPTCWVTQHGKDGLGHQLLGFITIMGLHGLPVPDGSATIKFDATPRKFKFEHSPGSEADTFLNDVMKNFVDQHCKECAPYHRSFITKSHPQDAHLNKQCNGKATHRFDTGRHGYLDKTVTMANIRKFSKCYIDALPAPQLPSERTLVLHIRGGDSGNRGRGPAKRIQGPLNAEVPVLIRGNVSLEDGLSASDLAYGESVAGVLSKAKYDNLIVHTDDTRLASYALKKANAKATQIHGRGTSVRLALSQMVNANVFIGSASAFSWAAGLLRVEDKDRTFLPKESNGIQAPHTSY